MLACENVGRSFLEQTTILQQLRAQNWELRVCNTRDAPSKHYAVLCDESNSLNKGSALLKNRIFTRIKQLTRHRALICASSVFLTSFRLHVSGFCVGLFLFTPAHLSFPQSIQAAWRSTRGHKSSFRERQTEWTVKKIGRQRSSRLPNLKQSCIVLLQYCTLIEQFYIKKMVDIGMQLDASAGQPVLRRMNESLLVRTTALPCCWCPLIAINKQIFRGHYH